MKTHELIGHLAEFKCDKTHPAEPPRLVKLKPTPKPCDDCGLLCVNRTVEISLRENPIKHWRKRCDYCKKWADPVTDEFTSDPWKLNNYYKEQARELNPPRKYTKK